jgi:hypothetical protein
MLSGNEIREIVMDSDSDEDKYYDSNAGRGATPTFATVFHFTASKSGLFRQQL